MTDTDLCLFDMAPTPPPAPISFAATGFDFRGCTNQHPDACACETWEMALCPWCADEIRDGQQVVAARRYDEDYDGGWDVTFTHLECVKERATAAPLIRERADAWAKENGL